jgi:hypothetical protein
MSLDNLLFAAAAAVVDFITFWQVSRDSYYVVCRNVHFPGHQLEKEKRGQYHLGPLLLINRRSINVRIVTAFAAHIFIYFLCLVRVCTVHISSWPYTNTPKNRVVGKLIKRNIACCERLSNMV